MARATVNGHDMEVLSVVDGNDRVTEIVAFCDTCSPERTEPFYKADVCTSIEIMEAVREAVQAGMDHGRFGPSLN